MPLPETVVDASVVVKWFLPEPSSPKALRLLRLYREEKIRLLAPVLLISEVSNVFCKRARQGVTTPSVAMQAFKLLRIHAPVLIDDQQLIDQAITLALQSGQAFYDCLYLALALQRGCDLITADQRFQTAVNPMFSSVLPL